MAVAYTQELLDRATAYVGQPLNSRRYAEGLSEISQLYSEISGQPVGTCQQCQYSDFMRTVQAYIREATRFLHPETMSESNYTIAPGFENETFVHESYGEAVTAETLTDKAAEFFIKNGYAHAFVKKAATKAPAEKPLTEKQQLQADFEKAFGTAPEERVTSADLRKHLDAREADADYQLPAPAPAA